MSITDPGEEGQEGFRPQNSGSILSQIKTGSTVTKDTGEVTDSPKITATVDSSKLKSMLAGLKKAD
jgi:hypothetical protein